MTEPLWTLDTLAAAAEGRVDGAARAAITGVSIDTRTLAPGDLFVPLTDQRDGHAFVPQAFSKGAAAALVRENYARQAEDGCLVRVDDPLAALRRIGAVARARLGEDARVVAVTGSAGKTTTKELLRQAFEAIAPGQVHASEKSYNNHWGVPLTLARMPRTTRYAVFEIGMNHADEIRPLTRLVRPHIALVINVLRAHIGNFPDGEIGIANAKAEIFEGLDADGIAVFPADSPHAAILTAAARRFTSRLVGFGTGQSDEPSPCQLIDWSPQRRAGHDGVSVTVETNGTSGPDGVFSFFVGLTGAHHASNAVAALAVLDAGGCDRATAVSAWAHFDPGDGRGRRIDLSGDQGRIVLIDESYNANPDSVRAALTVLGGLDVAGGRRRIAVLGDMLELGADGAVLHRDLAGDIAQNNVDLVFACGPLMRHLHDALPAERRGAWAANSTDLIGAVVNALRDGDVVMVKGSLGSRMQPLTNAIKDRYANQSGDN